MTGETRRESARAVETLLVAWLIHSRIHEWDDRIDYSSLRRMPAAKTLRAVAAAFLSIAPRSPTERRSTRVRFGDERIRL